MDNLENKINTYSTASLAYLGDSVIEICVREHLVKSGIASSAELNKRALEFVKAAEQAEAMKNILPLLTEEESIREVVAFPMNGNAQDMLLGAPNTVTEQQLREVHIKLR